MDMKVYWSGTFAPDFSRNRRLARLLELMGAKVTVVRVSLWQPDRMSVARSGKLHTILRAFVAYPLLAGRLALLPPPDVYLVSYPGWFDVPFVKVIALLKRRSLVFDPFISLHDTMIEDRGMFGPRSWPGRLARLIDRWSLSLADEVIADTPAHLDLYDRLSPGAAAKGHIIPLGADDQVFSPRKAAVDERLVFFHGSFVPLQGLESIVRAAALLRASGFRFQIVGDGQTRDETERLAKELEADNIEFSGAVPLEALPDLIAGAGICLGIFGTSDKAGRVVPHKLYECLAMGRPVITRHSPAVDQLLEPGEVQLVPPGDPAALVGAIRQLSDNPGAREALAARGLRAYRSRFHEAALVGLLESFLSNASSRIGLEPS